MVTQSKGDGFALYNGVKLPNIESVWTDKESYPYAFINSVDFEGVAVYSLNVWSINPPNGSSITSPIYYENYQFAYGLVDGWELSNSGSHNSGTVTRTAFWTSHDILNTDGSVYLAATDPITLDGMEVIEWDGDTTGLTDLRDMGFGGFLVNDTFIGFSEGNKYVATLWNGEKYVTYPQHTELVLNSMAEGGVSIWWLDSEKRDTPLFPVVAGINAPDMSLVGTSFLYGSDSMRTTLFAYTTASDPTFDTTTFLSGLTMGLTGKGVPELSGKCLYNGVELPGLPEGDDVWYGWDKEAFPHAVIVLLDGEYLFLPFTVKPSADTSVGLMSFPTAARYKLYHVREHVVTKKDVWKTVSDDYACQPGTGEGVPLPLWANFDVVDENGTIYLTASDPVPVVDTFTRGYLLGAELRNTRPAREPVAWLYNGVRLPKLPEVEGCPEGMVFEPYPGEVWLDLGTGFSAHNSTAFYVEGPCKLYQLSGGAWVVLGEFDGRQSTNYSMNPIWASADIPAYDGTVYLEASDPVPVYE